MRERPYQRLIAWKEAHTLCVKVYACTAKFPGDERFGIISQMRRSASSVPTNIAEGNTRRTKTDQIRFLDICLGSLEELHYQCYVSKDLQYVANDTFKELDEQIQRVGYLVQKLRSSLL